MRIVTRFLWLPIILPLLSAGCQITQRDTVPVDPAIVNSVYSNAVAYSPEYRELTEDRVMAACMDWERTDLPGLGIEYSFIGYVTPGVEIRLANEIESFAVERCNDERKRRSLQCECVPVLANERVVLRVPKEHIDRMYSGRSTPPAPRNEPAKTRRNRPSNELNQSVPVAFKWEGHYDLAAGSVFLDQTGDSGRMELSLPNSDATCSGTWRWARGKYGTAEMPTGVWSLSCSNGLTASGTYASSKPASGTGSGQDSNGRRITFTFGG